MKAFTNPNDPDNVLLKETLRGWLKNKLNLDDDAKIIIQEYLCSEPSCIHAETNFRVENTCLPDRQAEGVHFYKISKPLVYIRKWDFDSLKEIDASKSPHAHKHS